MSEDTAKTTKNGKEVVRFATVWTPAYGLARSLIAFGTLLTLAANDAETLFNPAGISAAGFSRLIPVAKISLFNLFPQEAIEAARWIAVFILGLVVIGWRPRITGLLHWWISLSFAVSCLTPDGGDHVATVLSLLLLPVTLTDPRKWHWSHARFMQPSTQVLILTMLAQSAVLVIRLQVCAIYLHAVIAKLGVTEWANGTALYYWFTHPVFGLPDWLGSIVVPFLSNKFFVTSLTWGVLLVEMLLVLGIALGRRWIYLLSLGLAFHFAIALVHGLISFFFPMAGALVLYLAPVKREVSFEFETPIRR